MLTLMSGVALAVRVPVARDQILPPFPLHLLDVAGPPYLLLAALWCLADVRDTMLFHRGLDGLADGLAVVLFDCQIGSVMVVVITWPHEAGS